MKRRLSSVFFILLILTALPKTAHAAQLLVPGGQVIGLELSDDTVVVAAFDDNLGASAKSAGLRVGDEIVAINEKSIDSTEDVRNALKGSGGNVSITIRRGDKQQTLHIKPASTDEGKKLGVYLRQGIAGVGTVTFYDPDTGRFGTLGHGVSSAKGEILKMTGGQAYSAVVESVRKGKTGDPGQLKGVAESSEVIGTLLKNTPQGVFGTAKRGWRGEPLPVAEYDDVTTGKATIRSTTGGASVREYSVEILKIYPENRPDCRNFLIKVIDPALLDTTGGIVQGMSGSPIIQNGRLIGAVTHVLVNDPTMGYGIFIENMLDAAA